MNDGTDYRAILASDTPLIDVRAPIEFAQGAMPAAFNLPLMNDDERAAVGTCYKRQGPDAALALGHSLVNGETREARISAWRAAPSRSGWISSRLRRATRASRAFTAIVRLS